MACWKNNVFELIRCANINIHFVRYYSFYFRIIYTYLYKFLCFWVIFHADSFMWGFEPYKRTQMCKALQNCMPRLGEHLLAVWQSGYLYFVIRPRFVFFASLSNLSTLFLNSSNNGSKHPWCRLTYFYNVFHFT